MPKLPHRLLSLNPPPCSLETLQTITQLLTQLLPATLSITCFISRWQVLRERLVSLKLLLEEIKDSAHWTENPILVPLLPAIASTLGRAKILCGGCCEGSATNRGKLLMQSDLDMASGWLSKHINDLELLLHSSVLNQSTTIVLSRPEANSSMEEVTCFIKDLFARLQIGGWISSRRHWTH